MRPPLRFVLGNAERSGHEIPPEEARESLEPGDLARLMLLSEDLHEPAWARVEEVLEPGWYHGVFETGEDVEFGPKHVEDIAYPAGPSMGALFDIFRWQPREPKPRRRGLFEKAAEAMFEPRPKEPKKGFLDVFDIFRPSERPVAGFEPIPEPERRKRPEPAAAPPRRPPPGTFEREEAPAPASSFFEKKARAPAPSPEPPFEAPLPPRAVIVPPEPPAEERPPAPPRMPFEVMIPEAAFPAAPPAFEILAPPGGRPGAPAGEEPPFEVLPPTPSLPAVRAETPFEILVPAEEPRGAQPFEVLPTELVVPAAAGPFEILVPGAPETRAVSPFETLGPLAELAPFASPEAAPPPPPEAPPKAARRERRRYIGNWPLPTSEEWIAHFERRWEQPIRDVMEEVKKQRQDPGFREMQIFAWDTGMPPTIPVETVSTGDWDYLFEFLGVPPAAYGPYLLAMEKEETETETGIPGESWEAFNEEFIGPLSDSIARAFKSVQPRSLPGAFVLGEDGLTEGQTYGLVYLEWMDQEDAERAQGEMAKEQEKAAEWARERMKARRWKVPPEEEWRDLIERTFDLDALFRDIRKERKTGEWKAEIRRAKEEEEDAQMLLQKIGNRKEGYAFYTQAASFLDIPERVMDAYFGVRTAPRVERDFENEFWDEVLRPALEALDDAFRDLMPRDLPGTVELEYIHEDGDLWLAYEEDPERRR